MIHKLALLNDKSAVQNALDTRNEQNLALCMLAASQNQPKIGIALIKAGANLHLTDDGDRTALHYASAMHSSSMAIALIEAGADVNAVTYVKDAPDIRDIAINLGGIQ